MIIVMMNMSIIIMIIIMFIIVLPTSRHEVSLHAVCFLLITTDKRSICCALITIDRVFAVALSKFRGLEHALAVVGSSPL